MSIEWQQDSDAQTMCARVARQVADCISQHRGARFSLALSGGSTPRLLHAMLARDYAHLPWHKVHIFWGDERCVPSTDAQSNYAMAADTLLRHVSIPANHVYGIPAERTPPDAAAAAYEMTLREWFGGVGLPGFDLVLLGMGADGHTASLFPGSPVLEERRAWVRAVHHERVAVPWRITLTVPVLQAAQRMFFVVAGKDKARVLDEIRRNMKAAATTYPAARVASGGKDVTWFAAR